MNPWDISNPTHPLSPANPASPFWSDKVPAPLVALPQMPGWFGYAFFITILILIAALAYFNYRD